MKKGWVWPVFISAALLFTVAVNVVMLFAAGSDANGSVVEPDYYRKAVEWDRTLARRSESERLGWRADVVLSPLDADGARVVELQLMDSTGKSIDGADVVVTMIHNLDAATPVTGALTARPAVDGRPRYAASLSARRAGLWEVRVEARRGDDRFQASLRANAP